MLTLEALNDRVIVKRITVEELEGAAGKKESLILVPETAKETPQLAEVVSAGVEVRGLMTRDKVIIGKYAGNEVTIDDTQYIVLRQNEILAKVVRG